MKVLSIQISKQILNSFPWNFGFGLDFFLDHSFSEFFSSFFMMVDLQSLELYLFTEIVTLTLLWDHIGTWKIKLPVVIKFCKFLSDEHCLIVIYIHTNTHTWDFYWWAGSHSFELAMKLSPPPQSPLFTRVVSPLGHKPHHCGAFYLHKHNMQSTGA